MVAEVEHQRASVFEHGASYQDVLQEVLDVRISEFRYCQHKVNLLTENELFRSTVAGPYPNEWIALRDKYASALERMAKDLVSAGLAERQTRIEEQQTAAVGAALKAACERIGMSNDMQRELAGAVREELAPLTAAREIAASARGKVAA